MIRDGYKIISPKIDCDFNIEDKKITVYAPCVYVANKGCTLGGGLVIIRVSKVNKRTIIKLTGNDLTINI